MKNVDVSYLNEKHEKIVVKYIKNLKKYIYFSTENVERGKYQQFVDIMFSVYLYSNNFYDRMLKKKDDGNVAEFLFLIPNMLFYATIGYLTALKTEENYDDMRYYLEKISDITEDTKSELADVLIDNEEQQQVLREIFNSRLAEN